MEKTIQWGLVGLCWILQQIFDRHAVPLWNSRAATPQRSKLRTKVREPAGRHRNTEGHSCRTSAVNIWATEYQEKSKCIWYSMLCCGRIPCITITTSPSITLLLRSPDIQLVQCHCYLHGSKYLGIHIKSASFILIPSLLDAYIWIKITFTHPPVIFQLMRFACHCIFMRQSSESFKGFPQPTVVR